MPRRLVAAIAVVAALVRVPTALRPGQLGFDDGSYGWSAVAMRHGALPFVDVFSGQGPLFLPLLRVADVVGLQAMWAPRLLGLFALAALVAVVGCLADVGGGRRAAIVAMAVVATSGLVFRTTTAIEADPVAAAFAAGAVLVGVRRGPWWLLGLVAGAALSVKSLLVVPAVVAAGVVYLGARGVGDAARAAGVAVAVAVALAAPWGIGDVWHQSVAFHLQARGGVHVRSNVELIADAAWESERLLVVVAVVALLAVVARRVRGRPVAGAHAGTGEGDRRVVAAAVIWLAGTAVILAVHSPLFSHHAMALVPPAAILVGLARPPIAALVLGGLLVLPGQVSRVDWRLRADPFPGQEQAISDLRRLVPEGRTVITDGPGLAWWAATVPDPWLVDISLVRIDAGYLTKGEIEEAAVAPDACAVLVWSPRLANLGRLRLPGYVFAARYGAGQVLWVRKDCDS